VQRSQAGPATGRYNHVARTILRRIIAGRRGMGDYPDTVRQPVNDFGRANGLHVFVAALLYFAFIVTGLIVLVIYVTR